MAEQSLPRRKSTAQKLRDRLRKLGVTGVQRQEMQKIVALADQLIDEERENQTVREEFVVCAAAGYPDPFQPTPNTLEEARLFAADHSVNAVTGRPTHPVIKRRLVSDWETVE